nr:hypothetical protein [Tanacetum cinerariifolium]
MDPRCWAINPHGLRKNTQHLFLQLYYMSKLHEGLVLSKIDDTVTTQFKSNWVRDYDVVIGKNVEHLVKLNLLSRKMPNYQSVWLLNHQAHGSDRPSSEQILQGDTAQENQVDIASESVRDQATVNICSRYASSDASTDVSPPPSLSPPLWQTSEVFVSPPLSLIRFVDPKSPIRFVDPKINALNGLATIQAQLKNLGREIKKANESMYAAHVGYELCNRLHYTKRDNGNPSYQEQRQMIGVILSKFMAESVKRHKEHSCLIKEIRDPLDVAIRNQGA